ncbi:hypothetical protein COLO4_21556 [Corchorus olitorius]|uniref:EGF-like domain-containing protein n=1 Tax=Corchorus olitorius TaxID=93759 RepID=A0A1R3ISN1_9ROSI|nr:hypothetical protein COLO4_21556 [Corchorus olitorius]
MASSLKTLSFLAIFRVYLVFFSFFFFLAADDICKEVECGKGKCNPSINGSFPYYVCECDLGWKQTRSDNDDHLKFLPCIVPNCTLNSECAAAPSPVQEKEDKPNESIFDICRWTTCGGGSCNKTSPFTYDCKCPDGYYNLLNVSAFPCYKECAIGLDCADLGILMPNKSTSTAPTVSQNDLNQAGSKLLGSYQWVMILAFLLAMVA